MHYALTLPQQHQLNTARIPWRHHPRYIQPGRRLPAPGVPAVPDYPVVPRLMVTIHQSHYLAAHQPCYLVEPPKQ